MGVTKIPDDYVKRSDVHKAFQPKYAPAINKTFAAMIDSVPAADVVERPCWAPVTERLPENCADVLDGTPGYRPVVLCCSNCHRVSFSGWAYCPNCGAKMDGGQDDV